VMGAAALLKKTRADRHADRRRDGGNLCRCGTYEKIRAGVHRAAALAARTAVRRKEVGIDHENNLHSTDRDFPRAFLKSTAIAGAGS